jgi:uncharacterized protein YuzE
MADIYVRLADSVLPSAVSTQPVADGINVDFDHRGEPIGVEVLGALAVYVNGVHMGVLGVLPDED